METNTGLERLMPYCPVKHPIVERKCEPYSYSFGPKRDCRR
jgi:hypothetical protein